MCVVSEVGLNQFKPGFSRGRLVGGPQMHPIALLHVPVYVYCEELSDPYPLSAVPTRHPAPHALARVGGSPHTPQSPPTSCDDAGGREPLRRPRTRHDSHTIVASTRARSRSTNLSIYLSLLASLTKTPMCYLIVIKVQFCCRLTGVARPSHTTMYCSPSHVGVHACF